MKGAQVILGRIDGREVAARVIDGLLQDLLVESDAPRPGSVYRARATRPVKGQGGMFFETPDGSAFMRGAKGIASGSLHLVQVSGYAEEGKAIPVSGRLIFKSRYAIATPGAIGINLSRQIRDEDTRAALQAVAQPFASLLTDCGLVIRSAAAMAAEDDVVEDIEHVLAIVSAVTGDDGTGPEHLFAGPSPKEQAWRDWADTSPAEGDLSEYLDYACQPMFDLPRSGSVSVEPTRAFVAVDVNTGGDTTPAAGLKANIAAARDLPRLLRIKGLGGQIVIDFAPCPKRDRKAIESALRAAFRQDDTETALVGWTPMGHYELNRKRGRAPLHEIFR